MKQRLLVALFTILVFVAGFSARGWVETERPLPRPLAEFDRGLSAPAANAAEAQKRLVNRKHLLRELARLQPEIEEYRRQFEEIDARFERNFATILNPEQLEKLTASQKQRAEQIARKETEAASGPPLTDEEILRLQNPVWTVIWFATTSSKTARLTRDYNLTEEQQAITREMVGVRRDEFLALLDSKEPPTIAFSRLASYLPRISEPESDK